jgi:N-acetylglucosaminyl-diphospho-decaprenol L-rhamnosyltransferase
MKGVGSAAQDSDARPDVSVVVVNWNTCDFLERCLTSLAAERRTLRLEVVVIDNGSTDGSQDVVRKMFSWVRLIVNRDNRGYSTANNQGIEASSGRYVFLLNSDTEVEAGALRALIQFGDANPSAGIIGPQLINNDGSLQPSGGRFPTPLSTVAGLFGLHRLTRRQQYGTRRDYSTPAVVDEVSGAALLVRREAIDKVGGLDESFAWGYEDIDLCRRVMRAGWQVLYLPGARIKHEWGGSRRIAPAATALSAIAGRHHYFIKHHGSASGKFVMSATLVSQVMRSAIFALGGLGDRRLRARATIEWEIVRGMRRRSN